MNSKYVIGIDFGSSSVRTVIVDSQNGETIGAAGCSYKRWSEGRFCKPQTGQYRQHPSDYLESMTLCVNEAVRQVSTDVRNNIKALAVDTTGSTPCPVNKEGIPLALLSEFSEDEDVMFYLWKDHTAVSEAEKINEVLSNYKGEDYTKYQGVYSSEWYWAKVLHGYNVSPVIRDYAYTWVEHCDWIPAVLSGCTAPDIMYHCSCVSGHKYLWNSHFGGLPPAYAFERVHPYLGKICERFDSIPKPSTQKVGIITRDWAEQLNLPYDTIIGGSSLDAHAGAVGAGIKLGTLVKVLGTSCVDMLVEEESLLKGKDLKYLCGQAQDSIIPGYTGIETSQAAFGDLFSWYKKLLAWPLERILQKPWISKEYRELIESGKENILNELSEGAEKYGEEEDIIVVDWFNGRRYPDINEKLKGGIYGLNLGIDAVELYKKIMLSAVFGSRRIYEELKKQGIRINDLIAIGGVAKKSPRIMQMLADNLDIVVKVSSLEEACAHGSAMYAAVAAGIHKDLKAAQDKMCRPYQRIFIPNQNNKELYKREYESYLKLGKLFEEFSKM